MAEGNLQEEATGNWWGSWLQTAKEKSSAALELVKKDLSEFTCTVRTDTSNVVAATSGTLQETVKTEKREPAMAMVKSGISSFLDGITRVLTIPPDDDPGDQLTIQPNGEATYDRGRARLTAIQLDPGTYCSQPSGSPEQYEMWQENFDLESKKGDISEMLVSRVEVRALYTKLVPSEVSHADFWARYFYKVHQLELDEARKIALMRRAEQTREESFTWDDDEGSDGEDKDSSCIDVSTGGRGGKGQETSEARESPQGDAQQPKSPPTVTDLSESFVKTDKPRGGSILGQDQRVGSPRADPGAKSAEQDSTITAPLSGHTPNPGPRDQTTRTNGQDGGSAPNAPLSGHTPNKGPGDQTDRTMGQDGGSAPKAPLSGHTSNTGPGDKTTRAVGQDGGSAPNAPVKTSKDQGTPQLGNVSRDCAEETNTKEGNHGLSTAATDISGKATKPCAIPESAETSEKACDSGEGGGKADDKVVRELKMKEKGDMVLVGSGSSSPISEASTNIKKEAVSGEGTDEDWDEDFDIELTEEDIRLAEEAAKKYKSPETLEDLDMMEDDWNWD